MDYENNNQCSNSSYKETIFYADNEMFHPKRRDLYRRRKRVMLKIYVCSPCRGDLQKNMNRARRYTKQIIKEGHVPITPHLFYSSVLHDEIPRQREKALEIGLELLKGCHEVRVYGSRISDGMQQEIKEAERLNIPVIYKRA